MNLDRLPAAEMLFRDAAKEFWNIIIALLSEQHREGPEGER